MEITSKRDIFGMIFFALSAIMLGYMFLTPLNHYIMHVDEYFTLSVLTLPMGDIINITSWDVHPPLYYILGKIAVDIATAIGMDSLHALRILSIIPYILILVISATKIRKDYGLLTAGLFAFSLAVMSEFFAHFLIARMYGWAILFIIVAFISFTEIIKSNDIKSWIILTIFSVLCAYTHYFAALSVVCMYILLLFYIIKFEKDKLKIWVMSVAGAAILYLPWIPPLIRQMTQVHAAYWIRQVNPDLLIKALGYIAYSDDAIICLIAIAVLIVLLRIYKKESKDAGEKECFLILSGARVYIGTILLAVIFSIVFKPILMPRYLLPAAAVMWLTISIIFAKIKSREMFMISASLIALLLVIGLTTTISTNDYFYNSGVHQKEILENITNDPNSMLIINNQNMIMYFLSYTNQTDTYCMNVDHVFGENMTQLHKFYDFNTFNTRDIDKLIANNTGKNIYIISWSDPVIKTPTEKIDAWAGVTISKAKTSNATSVSTNE